MMFKKLFEKKNLSDVNNSKVLVAAILVYAAKVDDKYTNDEKEIIKRALMSLFSINEIEAQKILLSAEIKEQ